jgi:hypothetical protein
MLMIFCPPCSPPPSLERARRVLSRDGGRPLTPMLARPPHPQAELYTTSRHRTFDDRKKKILTPVTSNVAKKKAGGKKRF